MKMEKCAGISADRWTKSSDYGVKTREPPHQMGKLGPVPGISLGDVVAPHIVSFVLSVL